MIGEPPSEPIATASLGRPDPDVEALLQGIPDRPLQGADVRAFANELSAWVLGRKSALRTREARAGRLESLAEALDFDAGAGTLRQFLLELRTPDSMVRLLAETGIPVETSLAREASRRLFARSLAIDVDASDFAALFALAHLDRGDEALLDSISPQVWSRFAPLLKPHDEEVRTAFELLLRRVLAQGLSRSLLRMGARERDRDSAFFALEEAARAFLEAKHDPASRAEFEHSLVLARNEVDRAHARTEKLGVSTELLFQLDQTQVMLDRLELIGRLLAGDGVGRELLAALLRSASEERSLSELINSKLKRLSRKVVEHASNAGEHYVVRTLREYAAMGASAAYGGALTAMAALVKFAVSATQLAPGLKGLAYSADYAICFVTMQFCGFTLASRQPSITAAALADSMVVSDGVEKEVELIAGISRAQTVAAAGNVLVALPTAILLDQAVLYLRGRPLFDAAEAQASLEILLPHHPMNMLLAAVTGVLLWLASLVGGWASNWSALHSLPLALAESPPLRRLFGNSGAARIGRLADRHFGGACGYVALGFMIGFAPLFAEFMGVPIWVPHVTLSAAALGFVASSQWWHGTIEFGLTAWAFVGVLIIGFLNFTVSFAMAFTLALRAMDVHGKERRSLLKGVASAFVRNPLRFLLPVRAAR